VYKKTGLTPVTETEQDTEPERYLVLALERDFFGCQTVSLSVSVSFASSKRFGRVKTVSTSRRSDPPPPPSTIRIWSQIPPGRYDLILLGSALGKWLHWSGKRPFLCLGEECPVTRHRLFMRWVGYYPAAIYQRSMDPQTGKVTHTPKLIVFQANPEQHAEIQEYDHFPLLVKVQKPKDEKTLLLEQFKPLDQDPKIPPPFDVYFVVCRAFGIRPEDPPAPDNESRKEGE
jgi:hypothetical protein